MLYTVKPSNALGSFNANDGLTDVPAKLLLTEEVYVVLYFIFQLLYRCVRCTRRRAMYRCSGSVSSLDDIPMYNYDTIQTSASAPTEPMDNVELRSVR